MVVVVVVVISCYLHWFHYDPRQFQSFCMLQGKDMFEEFYKSELARRLLLQRFSSIDLEKAAIARLKTVYAQAAVIRVWNASCRDSCVECALTTCAGVRGGVHDQVGEDVPGLRREQQLDAAVRSAP